MKTRLLAPSLLCALTLGASHARAATFYVTITGNDGNPGNQGQPLRTIRKAVTVVNPGDTVFVSRGMYTGAVNITRSGTSAAWITVSAIPGELATAGSTTSAPPTAIGNSSRRQRHQRHHVLQRQRVAHRRVHRCAQRQHAALVVERVNLFHLSGDFTTNIVRRTVSFENIDITTDHSVPAGGATDGQRLHPRPEQQRRPLRKQHRLSQRRIVHSHQHAGRPPRQQH